MRKCLPAAGVLLALSSLPALGAAQAQDDAATDRVSLLQARVAALERELQEIRAELAAVAPAERPDGAMADPAISADDFESLAAEPAVPAADASLEALAAPVSSAAGSSAANAFNPAVTLILNGSVSDDEGFSLGESELSLAANIDDKFFGQLSLAVESEDGEDHVGVEEAFIDTTSLPGGLAVRAGRFFSGIGYLNSRHAHTDSFFDRPLAYQAFLGEQYGDDGVQLRWVAPTSTFLELGGEVFRGAPDAEGEPRRGGLDARTAFVHAGGSVGANHEWLAGASVLDTSDGRLTIVDGTWKWAPRGNFKDAGVTVRSEYLHDADRGSGAYLEGVYRLSRTWDVGYRWDRLWGSDAPFGGGFDARRHSAEITWRNSEFSLLRLQLGHDRPDAELSGNSLTLQYQASLGAHGAHKF